MLNYTNIPVTVAGATYYASNASFTVTTPLEPTYAVGTTGPVATLPNGPIKGTFSLDYNIVGTDGIATVFDSIVSYPGAVVSPITVAIGDQPAFTGAYLTSHGAQGQANQLATAKASFDLYFGSTTQAIAFGSTGNQGASAGSVNLGHGAATTLTQTNAGITNSTSFNYDGTIEYNVIFKLGTIQPEALYMAKATKKITLEGYDLSNSITMCGASASASASVGALCGGGNSSTVYAVNAGKLMSSEGSISAGQVGRGKATIVRYF
jgi:hypothetical protein